MTKSRHNFTISFFDNTRSFSDIPQQDAQPVAVRGCYALLSSHLSPCGQTQGATLSEGGQISL